MTMEFVDADYELKEIQKLEGHSDRVWSLAWNPITGDNGVPAVFASCSGDKTVRIWEKLLSGSWNCTAILEDQHSLTVRSCAWSPSGKLLATASFDGTTAIWGRVGGDYECIASLEGHDNEVKSVSWSASGLLLATCGRDKSVWIWEIRPRNDFECVSVQHDHTQDAKMVQWHPFYDVLVSVSYDNSIKVWADDGDRGDWHCVQTLQEANSGHTSTVWKHLSTLSGYHDRTIFSVHWSREGVIASGAADDAICLFVEDVENMVDGSSSYKLLLKKERAHNMDINCVQWCPKEPKLLASTSDDGTIKIWELVKLSK